MIEVFHLYNMILFYMNFVMKKILRKIIFFYIILHNFERLNCIIGERRRNDCSGNHLSTMIILKK